MILESSKEKLRREAELQVLSGEKEDLSPYTKVDVTEIFHNLKVHEVELQMQNDEMLKVQMQLTDSKLRYFDLFDQAPVGYLTLSEEGLIQESNSIVSRQLLVEKKQLKNKKLLSYVHFDDRDTLYFHFKALYETKEKQETEVRFMRSNGTLFWAQLQSSMLLCDGQERCRVVVNDINQLKNMQNSLMESEEKYRLICTSMEQALSLNEIVLDENKEPVDFRIIEVNDSFSQVFGLEREKSIGKLGTELPLKLYMKHLNIFSQVALSGHTENFDSFDYETGKHYAINTYSPKINQFVILATDISKRIAKEEAIAFLNNHDVLTKLYNRKFYEEELIKLDHIVNLPLTIAVGDVNGLKLINDSLGHQTGDEILKLFSDVVMKECRSGDVLARIGGDEFVFLFPKTSGEATEAILKRIKDQFSLEKRNALDVSVSFGFASKVTPNQDVQKTFKIAEDAMYHNKVYESASVKSSMIKLIMTTLFEKNQREMLHSNRVGELCETIAKEMGLTDVKVSEVKLAGLVHDIGKIGIDEEILNCKHHLSDLQWEEMKRHSEIGWRILSSSTEFSEIACYVLEHHERWDGQGYPKGLKGLEISLPARIITLADSFDAMTRERTYGRVLSKEEAVQEITLNMGKQFDHEIAQVFIEYLNRG